MARMSEISTAVLVGYARVSTADQSLTMQIEALKAAGVKDDNLHVEKMSGAKNNNRKALNLALKDLRAGDTLVVWKLDRLSRDPRHTYELLDYLKKKGCEIRSLTEGFDSRTAVGRLFIAIATGFAAFERDQTIERTTAGIAAIKAKRARGEKWKWGRDPIMTPEKIKRVGELLNRAKFSGPEVAKRLDISTASVYAYWKWDEAKKRFVRKEPTDRGPNARKPKTS